MYTCIDNNTGISKVGLRLMGPFLRNSSLIVLRAVGDQTVHCVMKLNTFIL